MGVSHEVAEPEMDFAPRDTTHDGDDHFWAPYNEHTRIQVSAPKSNLSFLRTFERYGRPKDAPGKVASVPRAAAAPQPTAAAKRPASAARPASKAVASKAPLLVNEFVLIVDCSEDIASNFYLFDFVAGINALIARVKAVSRLDTVLRVVLFSGAADQHEWYSGLALACPDLREAELTPSGPRALHDAIAIALRTDEVDSKLVVVFSGGADQASQEYTEAEVQDIVRAHAQTGTLFAFLSAGTDALTRGGDLGVAPRACLCFSPDSCFQALDAAGAAAAQAAQAAGRVEFSSRQRFDALCYNAHSQIRRLDMTVTATAPHALSAGSFPCQCSWCCGIARGQAPAAAKLGAAAAAANAAGRGRGGAQRPQPSEQRGPAAAAATAPQWVGAGVAPQWKAPRPAMDAIVQRHIPLRPAAAAPAAAATTSSGASTAAQVAAVLRLGQSPRRMEWPATVAAPALPMASVRRTAALAATAG